MVLRQAAESHAAADSGVPGQPRRPVEPQQRTLEGAC